MRHELAAYEGQVRKFYATVTAKSILENGLRKLLLKDVAMARGPILVDHVWANWSCYTYRDSWVDRSAKICFNGKVVSYIKSGGIEDFTITMLGDIKRVELY